ncbi:helix-turn-helix domain-containing protein [Streptomyces massasporeus]|uniref:AlbA family DNA-binding domain-containing protein n=1 Tax=Streptomyces massasporeus TaxID=67324 RepID=UPI00371D04D3
MMGVEEVRQALRERRFDDLLGLVECEWLDVKGGIYQLTSPTAAEELVKDVAAFANTIDGGLLLVGFKTVIEHGAEVISELNPVPRARVDVDQHRKLIHERVVPTVRDLRIEWIACGDSKGVLSIDIPAQPKGSRPFVVPGRYGNDNKPSRDKPSIAVPTRSGDSTMWLSMGEMQRHLAASWIERSDRTPAIEESTIKAADRAKAARFLDAIPLDAAWIKILRAIPSLHRVPASLSQSAFAAYRALSNDVIAFLDSDVTAAYEALVKALDDLTNEFEGKTFPPLDGLAEYFEIPPEWKRTDHTRYYQTLEDLTSASNSFLQQHQQLVNLMNSKGLLLH